MRRGWLVLFCFCVGCSLGGVGEEKTSLLVLDKQGDETSSPIENSRSPLVSPFFRKSATWCRKDVGDDDIRCLFLDLVAEDLEEVPVFVLAPISASVGFLDKTSVSPFGAVEWVFCEGVPAGKCGGMHFDPYVLSQGSADISEAVSVVAELVRLTIMGFNQRFLKGGEKENNQIKGTDI